MREIKWGTQWLEGAVDMLEGRSAIQKDLSKVEERKHW